MEELWEDRLSRFAAAAEAERRKGDEMQPHIDSEGSAQLQSEDSRLDPVVKTIVAPLPPERAFALFFEGMAGWWPLLTHSVYEDEATGVTVEGREGGRIIEHTADGREAVWGEVLVWEPPARAVVTWHPGYEDEAATELELRFTAEGDLTRIDLEHRGWENLGERAEKTRAGYETGWNLVFGVRYGGAALRP